MIYLIAIIFSLAICVQVAASEVVQGNVTHLKHGRESNAGVALFPMIPFFQLLLLGIAWILEYVVPSLATWTLVSCFLAQLAVWLFSFKKLKNELRRAMFAREQS
jgi:hypothetical protein